MKDGKTTEKPTSFSQKLAQLVTPMDTQIMVASRPIEPTQKRKVSAKKAIDDVLRAVSYG